MTNFDELLGTVARRLHQQATAVDCPEHDELAAHALGMAEPAVVARVRTHLLACDDCLCEVEAVRRAETTTAVGRVAESLRRLADGVREFLCFEMPSYEAFGTVRSAEGSDRFAEGMAAYERGDHELAARHLEEALDDGDRRSLAAYYLGALELREGRPETARRHLKVARKDMPRAWGPAWLEALAQVADGDRETARKSLETLASREGSQGDEAREWLLRWDELEALLDDRPSSA
ncbi:MAG: hypothetical protein AAF533_09855 [Acidobacteriota bacterium]